MAVSVWTTLLLAAPLVLSLAAAYPHRAYREDADGQAPEKNVRHIDGLAGGASDAGRQLEEALRRQVEEQVRATGSGSASGKWTVNKYSEYSSSGAPVRATITGEALDGGDGVMALSTNCHNCRLRIRKVGGGGEQAQQAGVQVESSRYHSSSGRSEGQEALGLGQGQGQAAGLGYGGGAASSRVVQSSRVVESSGYGQQGVHGGARLPDPYAQRAAAAGLQGAASSSKETRVTKSSWNLADLGYGTSDIEELIRRLDEDMRSGRFQNGKTVTTVTTTTSENGGPPVTRQETFVRDGVDAGQFSDGAVIGQGSGLGTQSHTIGHAEVEELLRGLREELRTGRTQAGKTVTTVVESASVNGAAPVVRKKTFVRDGFDASSLDLGVNGDLGLEASADQLGQSGSRSVSRTTHSVWTSGSNGVDHLGGGNLLTSDARKTFKNVTSLSSYGSRTGDSLAGGHDVRAVDALGGGHLIRETGSYGSEVKGTRREDGPGRLSADHLVRETGGYGAGSYGAQTSSSFKETRRVDALGGGHLIRETGSYGASSGSDHLKGTRRVDGLGGGHLIRESSSGSFGETRGNGQASQGSLSVTQMSGYRKEAPRDEDGTPPAYGSTSKYYSTFQNTGYSSGGEGAADLGTQQGSLGIDRAAAGSEGSSRISSSSSSYKKVVSYSSSGSSGVHEERDLDHLGGGHLIRGVPTVSPDSQQRAQDVGGNQAFINAEQGGRIPEAASGSYFSSGSSSYHRASSGLSGVNPAAPTGTVVVPVRPSYGSGYGSTRSELADVQETRDSEYPPLGPAAPTSASVKLGYGSGNGGYGGPVPGVPDPNAQRGGKLTVSLMDIGILPAGSSQSGQQGAQEAAGFGADEYQRASSGSSGYSSGYASGYRGASSSGYGASNSAGGYGASNSAGGYGASSSVSGYGARSYSSRQQYESAQAVVPATSHASSWSSSHASYSAGTPSRVSSSYGQHAAGDSSHGGQHRIASGMRGQRLVQGQAADCDGAVAA